MKCENWLYIFYSYYWGLESRKRKNDNKHKIDNCPRSADNCVEGIESVLGYCCRGFGKRVRKGGIIWNFRPPRTSHNQSTTPLLEGGPICRNWPHLSPRVRLVWGRGGALNFAAESLTNYHSNSTITIAMRTRHKRSGRVVQDCHHSYCNVLKHAQGVG